MQGSITIRYFDGCPNWRKALADVEAAIDKAGLDLSPTLEQVETPESAERLDFRGSPTILIDGRDPFTDPQAPVGLSCRVYATSAGLAGSPGIEAILSAFENAYAR